MSGSHFEGSCSQDEREAWRRATKTLMKKDDCFCLVLVRDRLVLGVKNTVKKLLRSVCINDCVVSCKCSTRVPRLQARHGPQ